MKLIDSSSAVLEVDVQVALNDDGLTGDDHEEPPSIGELSLWAQAAYQASSDTLVDTEVTIRLVSEQEIQSLNQDYRQKDKPTNVLAFPFEMPDGFCGDALEGFCESDSYSNNALDSSNEPDGSSAPLALLGDVVICHSVVKAEAEQQNKTIADHYAHIVTHGVLHLCGYDHIHEQDALTMEALETNILAAHGIANPYS